MENAENHIRLSNELDLDIEISDFDSETVFADTLNLYRHMRKDLLCTLAESVVTEAKNKSRAYRGERYLFRKFILFINLQ